MVFARFLYHAQLSKVTTCYFYASSQTIPKLHIPFKSLRIEAWLPVHFSKHQHFETPLVTWGKAVVFAGYSGFLHHIQLAIHELATFGINVTKIKIPNSKSRCHLNADYTGNKAESDYAHEYLKTAPTVLYHEPIGP